MTGTWDDGVGGAADFAAELATNRVFAKFPPTLTLRLAECSERIFYAAQTAILTEGASADGFWAIERGRVAVGVRTPNRGLAVIDTLDRGDILGWSWLFPPYRWHFDAVALEPVTALRVHARCIRPYLEEDPRAAYALLQGVAGVMEERLRSARIRLIDMYGLDDDDD